jgi:hypothetical protein
LNTVSTSVNNVVLVNGPISFSLVRVVVELRNGGQFASAGSCTISASKTEFYCLIPQFSPGQSLAFPYSLTSSSPSNNSIFVTIGSCPAVGPYQA